VLTCSGEFDLASRRVLQRGVAEVLELDPRWLVVDLTCVTHLESGAVRTLEDLRRSLVPGARFDVVCSESLFCVLTAAGFEPALGARIGTEGETRTNRNRERAASGRVESVSSRRSAC
jgi:hypothetical protein